MPIVFRHDAAGIPLGKGDDTRSKYGMAMVGQQQKYDAEMRQGQQDAMYGMQRLGAMREMRAPSIGEDAEMMDNEIRSGAYDPDTVRALRDDERAIKLILRDRNLNATQQGEAIENIRSRMRMMRSTGRVQPMMQGMPQGQAGQQSQPLSARQVFRQDPKTMERFMGIVQQQQLASEGPAMSYEDQVRKALELYETQQRLLSDPQQGQSPAAPAEGYNGFSGITGQQGSPAAPQGGSSAPFNFDSIINPSQSPKTTLPAPAGSQPVNPVATLPSNMPMPTGSGRVESGVALAPGNPAYKAPPTPTDQRDELGYVIMSDGSRVDPRDSLAMSTGGRATQSDLKLTHPNGSPIERRADTVLRSEYSAAYPMQAISGMQAQGQPAPSQGGGAVKKWTSADGQFSTDGELLGVSDQANGEPMVKIRKTNGNVVDVPWSKLSEQDRLFVSTGGNRDTMFDLQNPGRTAGTNFMDPENPVYRDMMTPVPRQTPTPEAIEAQRRGEFGFGGVDGGMRANQLGRRREAPPEYAPPQLGPGMVATTPGFGNQPEGSSIKPSGERRVMKGDDSTLTDFGRLLSQMPPNMRKEFNKKMMSDPALWFNREKISRDYLARMDGGSPSPQGTAASPAAPSNPQGIANDTRSFYDPKTSEKDKQAIANRLMAQGINLSEIESIIKRGGGKPPTQGAAASPIATPAENLTPEQLNARSSGITSGTKPVAPAKRPDNLNTRASGVIQAVPDVLSGKYLDGYQNPEPGRKLNEREAGSAINSARNLNKKYKSSDPRQQLLDRINSENPGTAGISMDLENENPPAPKSSGAAQPSPGPKAKTVQKQPAVEEVNKGESKYLPSKPFVTTPEAKRFLNDMQQIANQYDPKTSIAVMSVYDPNLSEKERVDIIKRLQKSGVDLPSIESKLKADIELEMKEKRRLRNPRERTNKRESPQYYGT